MLVHLLASALVSCGAGDGVADDVPSLLPLGTLPSDEAPWVLAGSPDPELGGLGGEVPSALLLNVPSRQLSPFPAIKPSS